MKPRFPIFFLLLILLFISCEREVDVSFDTPEPVLTIESYMSLNEPATVKLNRSIDPINGVAMLTDTIKNASVELLQFGNLIGTYEYVDTAVNGSPGYIFNTPNLNIEEPYTINAKVPGEDLVFGTDEIPDSLSISSLFPGPVIQFSGIANAGKSFFVNVDFPADVTRYYQLLAAANMAYVLVDSNQVVIDTVTSYKNVTLEIVNDFVSADIGSTLLFSSELLTGEGLSIQFTLEEFFQSEFIYDSLFVELRAISPDYYFFKKSLYDSETSLGFGLVEPTNVDGNVVNAVGIHGAYNSTTKVLVVD